MALVKAKMSFYHDRVGTRALDEMFEVKNETLVSELEQAGYVQRVEGQALQSHEQTKVLQQEVGKINALTNEAVSMASHEHNQKTLKDQENFAQVRQQVSSHQAQSQANQTQQFSEGLSAMSQAQMDNKTENAQMDAHEASKSTTAKKANR